MRKEKEIIRTFYEEYGWEKTADGRYKDTALFTDNMEVVLKYFWKRQERIKKFFKNGGVYFLDAGSGAIPHKIEMDYSVHYKKRVCVDFSLTALKEARKKLESKGLYVLADITKLPFKDTVFDAIFCAHVLYHVPKDEQDICLSELDRVLSQNSNCIIIYSNGDNSLINKCFKIFEYNLMYKFLCCYRRIKKLHKTNEVATSEPPLYAHFHSTKHFKKYFRDNNIKYEIFCYGFLNKFFTSHFISNNKLGYFLLSVIFKLEGIYSHRLANLSQYTTIVIKHQPSKQYK